MATPPDAAQDRTSAVGPSEEPDRPSGTSGFEVHLDVFSGPFDLLLGLIAKHKLDITEVALSQVTDEFLGYLRAAEADLSQASEFLVVAATLLDLKAARLLPTGDVEDAEDLELLEARDLLFARLLQYRAYKEIADTLRQRWADGALSRPRSVTLEPQLAVLLPELVWTLGPDQLAALAARALAPKPAPPGVDLSHLHVTMVSVREQAAVLADRLRRHASVSFRVLVADAGSTVVVVGRFLALLELYREGAVAFDQVVALGDLTVRWTGSDDGQVGLTTGYDDEPGADGPDEPADQEAS